MMMWSLRHVAFRIWFSRNHAVEVVRQKAQRPRVREASWSACGKPRRDAAFAGCRVGWSRRVFYTARKHYPALLTLQTLTSGDVARSAEFAKGATRYRNTELHYACHTLFTYSQ